MAIDIIPGVGPQNSDIAAAVNAPSAATIASTVASSVPTLAQINTAVNTQTNNSAIATAVAGAVPTLAQITSTVQSNAGSPFGGTWTNLGSTNYNTNSVTISGLSSYRYLRFSFILNNGESNNYYIRLNGDTATNYLSVVQSTVGNPNSGAGPWSGRASLFYMSTVPNGAGHQRIGVLEIFGTNSGAYKTIAGETAFIDSGGYWSGRTFKGTWINTSAISSVTFLGDGGSAHSGTIWGQGAN